MTSTDKINSFFSRFKHQIYKKGEILIRADDNPPGVFYLKSGYVKQYAISKKGDEIIINTFKPEAIFPMSWVINDTANSYFYEATTDAQVWRAPKHDVLKFIKNKPDVLFDLLSRVHKGLDWLLMRMYYLMSGSAYDRLIIELFIHAKRFGKKSLGDEAAIELKISERELASHIGMARETISREIKLLKDKKLIKFNKNILIINNLNKLKEELSESL